MVSGEAAWRAAEVSQLIREKLVTPAVTCHNAFPARLSFILPPDLDDTQNICIFYPSLVKANNLKVERRSDEPDKAFLVWFDLISGWISYQAVNKPAGTLDMGTKSLRCHDKSWRWV